MQKIRLREFAKLEYGDPRAFLIRLHAVEEEIASETPGNIRALRTNGLKAVREMREAALFCFGMSQITGTEIRFTPVEEQDFDFVATWLVDDCRHYAPTQIKEVVPHDLNPDSSVQSTINSLTKYVDSRDLTVVIHLNRNDRFEPKNISIPDDIAIAGLWIFGAISEDQSQWCLWGNFMEKSIPAVGTCFAYPIP